MTQHVLHIISIWIIVLPLVAGIVNYKGLNGDSKWIFYLTVLAVIPQVLTFFSWLETGLLNITYNLYTPLEFIILYFLFQSKFKDIISRRIQVLSGIVYTLLSLYFIISFGIVRQFINYWVCVNNFIYILWILMFLKEQYHSESFAIRKDNPFAWYLLGLIIYTPCTLVVFCLYYYIRNDQQAVLMNLWVIHSICNILLYLFFSVGLFISMKELK